MTFVETRARAAAPKGSQPPSHVVTRPSETRCTVRYAMQPARAIRRIDVEGTSYIPAAEVCRDLQVSRQTLWRWRQEGKVPLGRRYRDHQVLFTADEVEIIRSYANRLEPAQPAVGNNMKAFRRAR